MATTPRSGAIPLGSFIGIGAGLSARKADTTGTTTTRTEEEADDEEDARSGGPSQTSESTSGTSSKSDDDDDRRKRDDEDEDEDGDEEMRGNSAAAQARRRERARCAAILGHASAKDRPDAAGHLAFNTTLTRREAIGTLQSMPAGSASSGLHNRMQGLSGVTPGPDVPQGAKGQKAMAKSWDRAAEKAGIKRS